jgi:DNA helicase-2/ATP-dependent DNA helicase PcrA
MRHHTVIYGSALHKAVEFYLRRRAAGLLTPLEDFLRAFEDAWRNEGFLTREHEEQRKRAGVEVLTRFHHEEEARGEKPGEVEKEFGFSLGHDRVRGRFDRVDTTADGLVVIDYKSSDVTDQKKADRRARESLQLKMYALAIREMTDRAPARVELRFLDSGLVGAHRPTAADLEEAAAAVKEAAAAATSTPRRERSPAATAPTTRSARRPPRERVAQVLCAHGKGASNGGSRSALGPRPRAGHPVRHRRRDLDGHRDRCAAGGTGAAATRWPGPTAPEGMPLEGLARKLEIDADGLADTGKEFNAGITGTCGEFKVTEAAPASGRARCSAVWRAAPRRM